MIDPEIQKELLKQTVEPRQALELAIKMELGMQNQHHIQQNNKLIPASVNAIQFPSNPRSANLSLSNNFQKPNNRPPLYCSNFGGKWFPNHRDKFIAKGNICNNCGLVTTSLKFVENKRIQKPKENSEHSRRGTSNRRFSKFFSDNKILRVDFSSGEDNTIALIENDMAKIEPLNVPLKIGNISITLLVHSRSACSILN